MYVPRCGAGFYRNASKTSYCRSDMLFPISLIAFLHNGKYLFVCVLPSKYYVFGMYPNSQNMRYIRNQLLKDDIKTVKINE